MTPVWRFLARPRPPARQKPKPEPEPEPPPTFSLPVGGVILQDYFNEVLTDAGTLVAAARAPHIDDQPAER